MATESNNNNSNDVHEKWLNDIKGEAKQEFDAKGRDEEAWTEFLSEVA